MEVLAQPPFPIHRSLDVAGLSPEKPIHLHPPPASLSWPTLLFLALLAIVWVARSSGLETSHSPKGSHPHLRTGSLAFPSCYPPGKTQPMPWLSVIIFTSSLDPSCI